MVAKTVVIRMTWGGSLKCSFPGFTPRNSNLVLWLESGARSQGLKILMVFNNSYIYTESPGELGLYPRPIKSG